MVSACNFAGKTKSNPESAMDWSTLIIRSEGSTEIRINNDNGSTFVTTKPPFNIFIPSAQRKVKIDTLTVYFTKAEKDSLYNLSKDLIVNPAPVKGNCTEFIGHLELIIYYGQFMQKGEYSSVCDWNKLSDKSMKLHDILRRRLKRVYLGENNIK